MALCRTLLLSFCAFGCSGPKETPRVEVPLVADASGIGRVETDLGYEVTVEVADVAIRDIEFTVAGEVHSSLWKSISDILIEEALAHPGHYQGGDVTGELLGEFVVHFEEGSVEPLGTAILLEGTYHSVNFFFSREESGILGGHTARLEGTARRDDQDLRFEVLLDSPEGRALVGAPFEHRVGAGSDVVAGLRLLVADPEEGDTLFDDVDFFALDADSDGSLRIQPGSDDEGIGDAYNQIHRRFQSHDHFDVRIQD